MSDISSFPGFRASVNEVLGATWERSTFDYLVNNAGFGLFNPIVSVTEAEFDGLFKVHLKAPFFLTQALLSMMAAGGHILNLSSATVRVATAGVAPYAVFKSGVEALTRYMAKEFADRRIRANAIAPGVIRTDLAGGLNDEFEALLAEQIAVGRVGEPDDIGEAMASLLADEWRYLNGQTVEVAGGYIL